MGEKPDQLPPRQLGQIRRVSKGDFQQAVDDGRARIGTPTLTPDSSSPNFVKEKFARSLLGNESMFGSPELLTFQDKLRSVGQDVEFVYDSAIPI